jgi:hypothetical protein
MINKNTPLSCANGGQQGRSMEGGATTAAATCRGRPNYHCGGDGGGNLLGRTLLCGVSTVVDEGGWWQLVADDSVDRGEQQQWAASSPLVVGGGEAIISGQWTMAG